jgi:hypothetical protein
MKKKNLIIALSLILASYCYFYDASALGERGNQFCMSQDENYTYWECSGSGDMCAISSGKTLRDKEKELN